MELSEIRKENIDTFVKEIKEKKVITPLTIHIERYKFAGNRGRDRVEVFVGKGIFDDTFGSFNRYWKIYIHYSTRKEYVFQTPYEEMEVVIMGKLMFDYLKESFKDYEIEIIFINDFEKKES